MTLAVISAHIDFTRMKYVLEMNDKRTRYWPNERVFPESVSTMWWGGDLDL